MFWSTAPFFVATITLLPLLASPVGIVSWIVLAAVELLAIFSLFGLYDPYRFKWCWRVVGGVVFAGYLTYLVQIVGSAQWIGDGRRSSATVVNALIGLVIFGYPGFMYAFFGRFNWRAESVSTDCYNDSLSEADGTDPVSNGR